jgi:hypothetical protein
MGDFSWRTTEPAESSVHKETRSDLDFSEESDDSESADSEHEY